MALQIAKYKGTGFVEGTFGDAERRLRLKKFGADLRLDSNAADWPQKVFDATGGMGVNLIINQLSVGVANQNMLAAALGGRLVNVGRLGGTTRSSISIVAENCHFSEPLL